MATVTLPDGKKIDVKDGSTCMDIALGIGERLARDALACVMDGKTVDLSTPVARDATLKILTFNDAEGKQVFRHSASHLLAHAVKRLFPAAKLAIGPAVQDGFYYDIDASVPFTQDDLAKIEEEMKKIVKEDLPFERVSLNKEDAVQVMQDEPYKVEMIDEIEGAITIYRNGDFKDLCSGPHVPSTGRIRAFRLTKLAGAYWKGDSKNKQLQRIYGVAFPTKDELKSYLKLIEEAEKRDHKRIGKEMQLYSFHDEGPGFPFIHPKGMVIWNELLRFWRELHKEDGYV